MGPPAWLEAKPGLGSAPARCGDGTEGARAGAGSGWLRLAGRCGSCCCDGPSIRGTDMWSTPNLARHQYSFAIRIEATPDRCRLGHRHWPIIRYMALAQLGLDGKDMRLADLEGCGDLVGWPVVLPNGAHMIVGDLAMARAKCIRGSAPATHHRVPGVILVCPEVQVVGPRASLVVAMMQHQLAFRDRANEVLVRPAVHQPYRPVAGTPHPHLSVAVVINVLRPHPARIGASDMALVSDLKGD